jgi:hypothetical protein
MTAIISDAGTFFFSRSPGQLLLPELSDAVVLTKAATAGMWRGAGIVLAAREQPHAGLSASRSESSLLR